MPGHKDIPRNIWSTSFPSHASIFLVPESCFSMRHLLSNFPRDLEEREVIQLHYCLSQCTIVFLPKEMAESRLLNLPSSFWNSAVIRWWSSPPSICNTHFFFYHCPNVLCHLVTPLHLHVYTPPYQRGKVILSVDIFFDETYILHLSALDYCSTQPY